MAPQERREDGHEGLVGALLGEADFGRRLRDPHSLARERRTPTPEVSSRARRSSASTREWTRAIRNQASR